MSLVGNWLAGVFYGLCLGLCLGLWPQITGEHSFQTHLSFMAKCHYVIVIWPGESCQILATLAKTSSISCSHLIKEKVGTSPVQEEANPNSPPFIAKNVAKKEIGILCGNECVPV